MSALLVCGYCDKEDCGNIGRGQHYWKEETSDMTIYETADGKLYTRQALRDQAVIDARTGWDKAVQGPFDFSFNDWLIEAINTGVIKEREVEI
jgi:hypothetical protein